MERIIEIQYKHKQNEDTPDKDKQVIDKRFDSVKIAEQTSDWALKIGRIRFVVPTADGKVLQYNRTYLVD